LLGRDGTIVSGQAGEGELLARADTMFSGYLGVADDDPEAWVDGWFRTGDVGRIDDEGYVYIEDRSKDVIVSGGMNVYPPRSRWRWPRCPVSSNVRCSRYRTTAGERRWRAVVVTSDRGSPTGRIVDHCASAPRQLQEADTGVLPRRPPRNAA
jgi:acyl-CoA synthetase (AMP-forming)/AMP-acid ligase II